MLTAGGVQDERTVAVQDRGIGGSYSVLFLDLAPAAYGIFTNCVVKYVYI